MLVIDAASQPWAVCNDGAASKPGRHNAQAKRSDGGNLVELRYSAHKHSPTSDSAGLGTRACWVLWQSTAADEVQVHSEPGRNT